MTRSYLYKCYTCGKEQIYSFNGDPPLILCEYCGKKGAQGHVAMELVKEVTE